MLESAGTLLYRRGPQGLAVLIVHPSGNYHRLAPWSIPKGLPEAGESLEAAARRETFEETGLTADGLVSLGSITYRKSRKRVHAFAGECAQGVPRCASWEVDRAEFVAIEQARQWLHPDQCPFLDRLQDLLNQPAQTHSQ